MKKLISMTAGLAALAIASSASAQTNIIRLTGSTAFRSSTMNAITHILNAGFVYGYSGTTFGKATAAEFRGTTIVGSYPVDIKVYWSGSVGGVQTVVTGITQPYWPNAVSETLTTGGLQNLNETNESGKADVAMSDSFQASTAFHSPVLKDQVVGVVPFQWCKNAGSPSNVTNITDEAIRSILANGAMPLSQLTGNAGDAGNIVYVTGRDEDSGTRLGTFAECGWGIFTPPIQYQPTISGGQVTGLQQWPANTVNGTLYPVGHSGYSSGGSVSTALNATNAYANTGSADYGNASSIIAYLGVSDAANVNTSLGGGPLTYDGTAYSTDAVANGQYPFWTYEHLLYNDSTLPATSQTIANQLAKQIHDVDATAAGILLSTMQFGRTVEGGVITYGNPY